MSLQHATLGAVLQLIRAFITQNPSELVIFRPRYEANNDALGRSKTNPNDFLPALRNEVLCFSSIPFIFANGTFNGWSIFSSGTRNGRIVYLGGDENYPVLGKDALKDGMYLNAISSPGPDFWFNTGDYWVQNTEAYGKLNNDNAGELQSWLEASDGAYRHLMTAAGDVYEKRYYNLSLNASNFKVVGTNLDPIDAANYINPKINRFLAGEEVNILEKDGVKNSGVKIPAGARRVGLVTMDFAGKYSELAEKMVGFNLDGEGKGIVGSGIGATTADTVWTWVKELGVADTMSA
jgi:hypothetical protein